MAAANVVARPPLPAAANQQHKPRASGSWDDLLRNKGQDKAQQARARAAQNDSNTSRRPYSSGVDWRPTSQAQNQQQQQQQQQPIRARMELYHPDQRSSQAFAAHVAALNGNPSPLSKEVMLGPEFDAGSPDYGIMPPGINHFSLNNRVNRRSQTYPLPQQAPAAPQRPGMYARPRRTSSGGGGGVAGPMAPRPGSFHSFEGTVDSQGRMRAHSWGGMPVIEEAHAFETFPPAHYSPHQQQLAYRNSAPAWQQRRPELIKPAAEAARGRKPGPDELFSKLPVEVLRLVLGYVRAQHLGERGSGGNSCATCWMRDCCAVALCNRRLLAVAREALYSDIQLVGRDGAQMGKRNKGLQAPRLVLLRRTLRANRSLGAVVRSLKVPALPDGAPIEATKYHDVVASVVMACPNLERLDGFYPSYRHGSESHLLHALETRRRLKEMTWIIEATPEGPSSTENGRAGKKTSQSRKRQSRWAPATAPMAESTPDLLQQLAAAQANRFVMRHDSWKELTHLTIHCLPGAGVSPDGATVGAILALLPGIDSLYLSHLPASSFSDESLLRVPRALKKLGIAHCAGVTTAGLAAFAARSSAASSLETLTLIHQGVDSVDALVRILAKLDNLDTINIVQAAAPAMGDDTFLFMPYLASRSLRKLHWDIQESGIATTKADDILSRSIAAGGFPRLRVVRVPNDPDGLFQALCKPRERADLPGDRYRTSAAVTNNNYSKSSTNLAIMDDPGARSSSDTKDSGKELRLLPAREYGSDLHAARLAAQARLEAARRFPRFEATVVDDLGEVVSSEGLAGFIGDAGSRIQYCLVSDEGGTDARGGLAVMDDLLGDGGEDLLRKGDVSNNAGGGFGTGVAPCCVVPGQQQESVPTRGRLIKRDSGGRSSKEKEKEKEKERERERDAEEAGRAREGCTGRWNSYNPEGLVDKKSASGDRWWHVERGRWRGRVELS
ncbi:hypothetical protein UCDDA912_g07874 [Diaporthe ampelina]|uniref:F-box domain-containing protein n=1 Tax=Diaporthe ampelina TaxID=1214573 RepID=A0A0G2FDC9_9PEZI|nr:hypothetical protein UCDDA912_g07874 [Diaporthe ampelina]